MLELAVKYRVMQIAAHNFHNLCGRTIFAQDHEWFGDLYGDYEGCYDDIIERIIGTRGDQSINVQQIMAAVTMQLKDCPNSAQENKIYFNYLLNKEKEVIAIIQQYMQDPQYSEGTKNMLADKADKAEVRCYKIQQRLK